MEVQHQQISKSVIGSNVISSVVLTIYYQEKDLPYKVYRINIQELIERDMAKKFKEQLQKLKLTYRERGIRFIRAEINTTDFYFIYPLYGYKSLDDIIENLEVFRTIDILEPNNTRNEFITVVKDKLNSNRLEFWYYRDRKTGFLRLYHIKMYPRDF